MTECFLDALFWELMAVTYTFTKSGNLSRLQSRGYIYIPVITTKSLEVNQTSSTPIKAFNEFPDCQKPLPHTAVKLNSCSCLRQQHKQLLLVWMFTVLNRTDIL